MHHQRINSSYDTGAYSFIDVFIIIFPGAKKTVKSGQKVRLQ